jgi:hypothetical protein
VAPAGVAGIDRGGAGMVGVAGADPADPVLRSERDHLLDGARHDEAAEPVVAIAGRAIGALQHLKHHAIRFGQRVVGTQWLNQIGQCR